MKNAWAVLMCAACAILGCEQAGPGTLEVRHTPHAGEELTVVELMRLIHGIKGYPGASEKKSYRDNDWDYIIDVACVFQESDHTKVEIAFRDYVVHYDTAFERDVDKVKEWSKIHVLLRVMFVLPESQEVGRRWAGDWSPGGFVFAEMHTYEHVPQSLALPVSWRDGAPHLVAGIQGYFGPSYSAVSEYRFFLQNFEFRDLTELREKCG